MIQFYPEQSRDMNRTEVAGGDGLSGLFLIPYGTGRRCKRTKALIFCQLIKGTIILSGAGLHIVEKYCSLNHMARQAVIERTARSKLQSVLNEKSAFSALTPRPH